MAEIFPVRAVMRNAMEIIRIEVIPGNEVWHRAFVGREERLHVHGQIAASRRQVAQRLYAQAIADRSNQGAARQLFAAINHHGAGTAHPDAAGRSEKPDPGMALVASAKSASRMRLRLVGNLDGVFFEMRRLVRIQAALRWMLKLTDGTAKSIVAAPL